MIALHAERLFTGHEMRADSVLLIQNGRVRDITRRAPPGAAIERLAAGLLLAPGFVDLQVNGGGGVLFNDMPTAEGLRRIASAHRRFGTTGIMATLITDTPEKMREAADAVAGSANDSILGLHFEGPLLNPDRKGVHRPELMRAPDAGLIEFLCHGTPRPLIVTLAPEIAGAETVARLAGSGIIVCIGHSAASFEEACAAIGAGARGFTHLFNAMPPLSGRNPGVVGAALRARDGTLAGIIADGHHVHAANLRLALSIRGAEGLALVTDAMSSVGSEIESFDLQGRLVRVRGGRLTTGDGTLAGAHLDMASALRNAVDLMGASVPEALSMASRSPAEFLGIKDRGILEPGARADIVALTDALQVARVWLGGQECRR